MASPQVENGYTKIANELLEALYKIRISGEAMQILLFIIRQTYGFSRKTATLPLRAFSEELPEMKKPSIIRAIKKLTDMKLINVSNNANNLNSSYCLNKNYEQWQPLAKKLTPLAKKLTNVSKKANATPSQPLNGKASGEAKEKRKIRTTYCRNSFEFDVAEFFWKLKAQEKPPEKFKFMKEAKKNDFQDWAHTIHQLIEIDGKTQDMIRQVLRFSIEDDFWKDNLLSLSQLRKKGDHGLTKFEMIQAKMERKPKEKEDHTFIPTYERLVP